ncbi:hypothetical protein RRG08_029205 [Elysia crispata]|uniref:Uncharacterized protein n=1 Tax=Elysia crispata TaxID=231223 RepID=A0AAE1AJR9_9GAST|nr:hypothetical protein RRG08_029205 [Elysia crispata]
MGAIKDGGSKVVAGNPNHPDCLFLLTLNCRKLQENSLLVSSPWTRGHNSTYGDKPSVLFLSVGEYRVRSDLLGHKKSAGGARHYGRDVIKEDCWRDLRRKEWHSDAFVARIRFRATASSGQETPGDEAGRPETAR